MNSYHLLFDFGGVLVDLKKEASIASFDALGFDIRPFLGTFRQGGVFAQLENGDLTLTEFCTEIRRLAGNPALTDSDITAAWEAYLTGIPTERLRLLRHIGRAYPVYALSNTNIVHWTQSVRHFFTAEGRTVSDYFKEAFLSYELHCQKPDPEIFRIAVERMGCSPEEVIFFDDSADNCTAARACGLHARLAPAGGVWMQDFTPDGQLRESVLAAILADTPMPRHP